MFMYIFMILYLQSCKLHSKKHPFLGTSCGHSEVLRAGECKADGVTGWPLLGGVKVFVYPTRIYAVDACWVACLNLDVMMWGICLLCLD